MKNFRTYQLSLKLTRMIIANSWNPAHIKDQICRASLSITLNLAEGYGRKTLADRKRFFTQAMGSLREVQACLDLAQQCEEYNKLANILGAHIYKLIQNPGTFP